MNAVSAPIFTSVQNKRFFCYSTKLCFEIMTICLNLLKIEIIKVLKCIPFYCAFPFLIVLGLFRKVNGIKCLNSVTVTGNSALPKFHFQ